MTIAEKSAATCSPQDEEVTLLDQLKWVSFGYSVDDVTVALTILLTEAVVQKTTSKQQALQYLAAAVLRMAEDIERDYEIIKLDATTGQAN
jgi:hypothetical protein